MVVFLLSVVLGQRMVIFQLSGLYFTVSTLIVALITFSVLATMTVIVIIILINVVFQYYYCYEYSLLCIYMYIYKYR